MTRILFAAAALAGLAATAAGPGDFGELKVTADRVAAARDSRALVASGHVHAVAHPISLLSELAVRDADGSTTFADPTSVTTCTNEAGHLHWQVSGEVVYKSHEYVLVRNAWFRFLEVPILWLPYWKRPLYANDDSGFRLMPGWTKRWGAYLLTEAVYHLAGDPRCEDNTWWLRGNTRFDLRYENGIALGEELRWNLGDFGRGKFKVYYAWDQDADRYSDDWDNSRSWHYANWNSDVPGNRYDLELEHRWEVTERDTVRLRGQILSDSSFEHDFRGQGILDLGNRFRDHRDGNEIAWEHQENAWGGGLSASGPIDDFWPGVSRLPELYFDVAPTPVWNWPVNYESQSRLGYLMRDYGHIGNNRTDLAYRCNPGPWADYDALRFDTYHRLSAPFKVADALSVVPRLGYRGTFWSESGLTQTSGYEQAGEEGGAYRSIGEAGVTFAGRGTAWIDDEWQHMIEPYVDVLAQKCWSNLGDARPYVFDSLDASCDWSDQLAGRSRNLPYTYYGVTPGLRNAFRTPDERGNLRTVLDLDVYAACQLNDADYLGDGANESHRMAYSDSPNREAGVTPGVRTTWHPSDDTMLGARMEFDLESGRLALADGTWAQKLSKRFSYHVSYFGRDHRIWDFAPSPYDPETMNCDEFNWLKFSYAEVGFEHEFCDRFAWSPFVRWDCRDGELDKVGSWFDYRLDCIGFRLILAYENEYERVDGSTYEEDFSVGLMIYLRAFGPSSGLAIGED